MGILLLFAMTTCAILVSYILFRRLSVSSQVVRPLIELEILEDRVAPSVFHWVGDKANRRGLFNWSEPANWLSNEGVPGPSDVVIFDFGIFTPSPTSSPFSVVDKTFQIKELEIKNGWANKFAPTITMAPSEAVPKAGF